ncbi:protein-disulfide reductase DsbD family protein [Rhodoferax mekongensis]|uniref:Thioredoxin family protein n=1 Tax=Rhodoferax mekongensis TaxID=3068341 RepID=A0ABZ0AZN7_9BURK|nr:thioredoxin family protein [Rhodoferax sp. TBRC 17307]WNO04947.1 thioredoxin family protein [Rhodoferax sp. TBRC 17307]
MNAFSHSLSLSALFRSLSALLLIAACALPTGSSAQLSPSNSSLVAPATGSVAASQVKTDQVVAELVVHAPDGVTPGKTLWLGLLLQHQPHWHTYWKNPGDSGLPTQLQWTLPAGLIAGDIAWPVPRKIAIGTLANLGYEGEVLLPVPVKVDSNFRPAGLAQTAEIQLQASWLVCREECIPQEGSFRISVPVRGSMALHAAQFAAAQAAAPVAFQGKVEALADARGLLLRVSKLPAGWVGKAVQALPETPELLNTPALPATTDTLTGGSLQAGQQGWDGATWQALVPYSAQRSTSPGQVAWVFSIGKESLRGEATVTGTWPAVAEFAKVPPALQAALDNNARAASVPPAPTGGMVWMVLAALLGGLILNLMPCVFPVLAIKVLGFAAQGTQSRAQQRAQGLAYTAGVVLSFMALGGLLLALRAGGEQLGWGFQLQSPAVITGLAVLFTLLAMNLAGWLHIGNLLPAGLAGMQLRHPVAEAFLSGVLAVAIASPCTAPFMGASLGYAITLPGLQSLVLFAALGLGLALPYLLASWLPAIGSWLPRPGAWMETLKHFLAFPMAATVVWLVWVLGHLSGVDGAASLLLLLLSLGLLAWALRQSGRAKTIFTIISIAACTLSMGATWQFGLKADANAAVPASGSAAQTGAWQAWSEPAVQAALQDRKPVFVDFTAAWCITCQVNKKTTLSKAEVEAAFAAKQVRLLRADWTRRDPAITQALQALGRSGVPVYVLYAPGKPPVVLTEILTPGEVLAAVAQL